MSDEESKLVKMNDVETAAVAISTTIIVFFVIYWAVQIDSVRDLLKLAYG